MYWCNMFSLNVLLQTCQRHCFNKQQLLYKRIQLCVFSRKLSLEQTSSSSSPKAKALLPGHVHLQVTAGNGGNGTVSYFRDKNQAYGKPDGGNGGNGGHVIFIADENCYNFSRCGPHLQAKHGTAGRSQHCNGKSAPHLYVQVPCNTVVRDDSGRIIGYLQDSGSYHVAARGGGGGRGNHYFATLPNRVPILSESGAVGEHRIYYLSAALKADIGLISYDDAACSELLARMTGLQKRSMYQGGQCITALGMLQYDDYSQLSAANISALPRLMTSITQQQQQQEQQQQTTTHHFCTIHQLLCTSRLMIVINLSAPPRTPVHHHTPHHTHHHHVSNHVCDVINLLHHLDELYDLTLSTRLMSVCVYSEEHGDDTSSDEKSSLADVCQDIRNVPLVREAGLRVYGLENRQDVAKLVQRCKTYYENSGCTEQSDHMIRRDLIKLLGPL